MTKIQPPSLPVTLRGPLIFGNRDQIEALQDYYSKLDKHESVLNKIRKGELRQYEVTISYEGFKRTWVMATSEEHARALAEDRTTLPHGSEVEYVDARLAP